MECHLCGSKNDVTASHCYLCNVKLKLPSTKENQGFHIQDVDISKGKFSKKKLFLFCSFLIAMTVPWFWMSDLLSPKTEAQFSRVQFFQAKDYYLKDAKKWDEQKESLLKQMQEDRLDLTPAKMPLSLKSISMEVVMSYLIEELGFSTKLSNSTLYFQPHLDGTSITLTKYEEGIWPLKILLSLEILLKKKQGRVTSSFVNLYRGSRPISIDLAYEYFTQELTALRPLETISGGIQEVEFLPLEKDDNLSSIPLIPLEVSLKYSHRGFYPDRDI